MVVHFGRLGLQKPPRSTCSGATRLQLTPDYQYFVGSAQYLSASGEAESGSRFAWLTNGAPLATGPVAEDLLLHFDGSATGANGEIPTVAQNLAYATGKWGSCLALPGGANLQFSTANNLHLNQGTIEMWVALRAERHQSGLPAARDHLLFHYKFPQRRLHAD